MVSLSLTRSGIKPKLPSPLPELKKATLEDTQRELLNKTVFGRDRNASVIELSENVFRNKLEKHIDDYESGKGYKSRKTGGEVLGRHLESSSALNNLDPDAGTAYSAYSGGFSYGRNARFKAGVGHATEHIQRITAAYEKEEELSNYYSDLAAKIEAAKAPTADNAPTNGLDITV